jgi:hypothetical protein
VLTTIMCTAASTPKAGSSFLPRFIERAYGQDVGMGTQPATITSALAEP